MAVSLNTFYTQLNSNQLRTQNMYEVEVHADIGEVDQYFTNGDKSVITMYAEGFAMPDRTQEYANAPFKGYDVPVPTVMKMGQDHTMTIRADVAGNFRRGFLTWAKAVTDPVIAENHYFAGDRRVNLNSYIKVNLLGNGMQDAVESVKIVGVKISSVGGLTVSNADSGIATFEVGFKSLYWFTDNAKMDTFDTMFDSNPASSEQARFVSVDKP